MRKSLVIGVIAFLFITNIIFVCTTVLYKTKIDKQQFKVYSFEGENKDIRISNGLIIIFPEKHIVNGGQIQYIGNKHENIQSYTETIYLDKKRNKDTILSKLVSDNTGIAFSDEFLLNKSIGEISSNKLFVKEDINIIKDDLYFSLDYSTVDRQTGSFIVKLNVKEFNMYETK